MNRIQGPRGREYPEHNPKTVCLLGMGPSVQDFMQDTLTQELKPDFFDEVWGINMVANTFRCDLCFWMDDLEQQAKLMPHFLLPTKGLKSAFPVDQMESMIQAGGAKFAGLLSAVHSFPEYIPAPQYEYIVEEFKTMLNSVFGGLSYGSVIKIMSLIDGDKKSAIPDPNKTLKGLIEVLDRNGVPVISAGRKTNVVRNSFDYPVDEVAEIGIKAFGKPYLNNGVAMAIGYAIWKGVKLLRIYGCDFTYPNRNFAETGRGCVEAWIVTADKSGMNVVLCPHTSLLDQSGDIGIYGYAEQPEVFLSDGTVFQYQKSPELQGQFYRPEVVGKHAGVTSVVSTSAQADSASGSSPRLVPGYAEREYGHAADHGGADAVQLHPAHIPQTAAP